MKIRRSVESVGRFMSGGFWRTEPGRADVTQPDRDKAQNKSADRVPRGTSPLPVARQRERLQAEGRIGREAAKNSRHHEMAGGRADKEAAVGIRQRSKRADDEAA